MTTAPPYAHDWPGLAAVAERLRADRERGDPDHVKSGGLTQRQADDRARISRALALQWRAIVRRQPVPALDAGPLEIRLDLESAAAATARRAKASSDAAIEVGRATISYAQFAEAVAALLWQQQPYRDGITTPRILFVHGINLMARARRAERPAPSPAHATGFPVAPPHRQSNLI